MTAQEQKQVDLHVQEHLNYLVENQMLANPTPMVEGGAGDGNGNMSKVPIGTEGKAETATEVRQ
jgi:hypothetical protein